MYGIFSMVGGAFLMALALVIFISPGGLVTGGASGISVIVRELSLRMLPFAIPLWFTNLAVNVPLLIWARVGQGRRFAAKTLAGTLLLSFFLWLLRDMPVSGGDEFINTVFGGTIMGLGVGLVLAGGATTGGSDLLASLLHEAVRSMSIAALIFIIDVAVIFLGILVFGVQRALYSVIAVYISTKMTNLVLEGLNFARVVFVMSDKAEEIAAELMRRLGRGATLLEGRGAYTGTHKNVVMMVMSRRQAAEAKRIASAADPSAFMFVADVREVLGDFS